MSTQNYLSSGSLTEALTYSVTGLTAGKTYVLKVYAQYDLNDNNETVEEEIGSMTFSSSNMSSYGRIYYTFKSSHIYTDQPEGVSSYDHILYQSATAQQILMNINTTRTNATLAKEYYHNFEISFKDKSTSEELATFSFYRNTDQSDTSLPSMDRTVTFTVDEIGEDGSYTYTLNGAASGTTGASEYDYLYTWDSDSTRESGLLNELPTFTLTISNVTTYVDCGLISCVDTTDEDGNTVVAYSFNLWDVFIAVNGTEETFYETRPSFALTFDEGALSSYNSYTVSVESYAAQGTVTDHTVTATSSSYRQNNFTTLKEMPYVTIGGLLQIGKYLYLENICLNDPDESIYGAEVTLKNSGGSSSTTTTQTYTIVYNDDYDGLIESSVFSGLRLGTSYTLSIIPTDIRRTGKTTSPRYQNTSLWDYTYVAGEGVTGEILLSGIAYPLSASGDANETLSKYNVYEVGTYQYGSQSISICAVEYGSVGTGYKKMDPIAVTPGQVYYFHNLSSGDTTVLVLLDSNKEPVATMTRTIADDGFIVIPDGVYYIQARMNGTITGEDGRTSLYSCTQAQLLLVYDSTDDMLKSGAVVSASKLTDSSETVTSVTFSESELTGQDMFTVVNSDWTNKSNGTFSITYSYVLNGTTYSETVTGYPGFSVSLPTGITSLTVSTSSTLTDADGDTVSLDVRLVNSSNLSIFSDYDVSEMVATYSATVTDSANSLSGDDSGDVQVVVTDTTTGETVSAGGITAAVETLTSGGYYNGQASFTTESGHTYELVLSVKWHGKWYELDSESFTAEGVEYSIASVTQLVKTVTWPTAKFVVTADLEDVDTYTRSILNQTFSGELNGDGHTMSVDLTTGSTLYGTLTSSGIIENFYLDIDMGSDGETYVYKYLIGENSGTIRNVVISYKTGTRNTRYTNSASITYRNKGTIENFALYYESASDTAGTYMASGMGGLVVYNGGVISNGVVYNSKTIDVNTAVYGGSEEVSNSSVGGVAASNQSGAIIENVLVIADMRVETNKNVLTSSSNLTSYGLIAGSNSGMIRNCVTNGDMMYSYWDGSASAGYQLRHQLATSTVKWPGSWNQGSSYTRNCYYFSSGECLANDSYTTYMSSTASLRTSSFYNGSVNNGGAFVVDSQLENEYYPIVDMPDCMDGLQMDISLNASSFGNRPTFLSSTILTDDDGNDLYYFENQTLTSEEAATLKELLGDEWENYVEEDEDGNAVVYRQFVLMEFTIANRNSYYFDNLTLTALSAKILAQETTSNVCALTVLVSPWLETTTGDLTLSTVADAYGSSSTLESFDYGYSASSLNTVTVDEEVSTCFYYPLPYSTWGSAPTSSTSKTVNYRLIEDISFETNGFVDSNGDTDSSAYLKALSFFNSSLYNITYGGIFDGGGYTLDFDGINLTSSTSSGSYFAEILRGGTIQNLNVKNLTLGSQNNYTYMGLVGVLNTNATLDGINLTGITITNAYGYAGALAAQATNATIVNCTAVD
ncbi:MAG: hypothetical protein LUE63_00865, partial [Lachnospiraceae bacterium]|nr:hypothetical protein [Lachnospiraceae bacterium]